VALLPADYVASVVYAHQGEFIQSRKYSEHGLALYDIAQHGSLGFRFGIDPGVGCGIYASTSTWYLGYPDQAFKKAQAMLSLAQELAHPMSRAWGPLVTSWIHLFRREYKLAEEEAEMSIALSVEKGQSQTVSVGTMIKGYALAEQGKEEEGLSVLQEGFAIWHGTGAKTLTSMFLFWLAQVYERLGREEEGLAILAEALAFVEETGEHMIEAELYRLKGELLLMQAEAKDGV
jgi:predicted ATPase